MNITRFSISRPVGISMIVAFFVVLGCYSYYRIGVELLPALNTPYVTVTVKYPGASAESVEQEIVKLEREATVWLMFDQRLDPLPAWAKERFTDSGKTATLDPGETFRIYRAKAKAGDVRFGSQDSGAGAHFYLIAVTSGTTGTPSSASDSADGPNPAPSPGEDSAEPQ